VKRLVLVALTLGALSTSAVAQAQGMMGGPRGGSGQQQQAPTQSGPVQNRSVGPRAGQTRGPDDDDSQSAPPPRANEPAAAPPSDPLAIPPEVAGQIGTDADMVPPAPVGPMHRTYFPYYEERKGDYRFRLLPPLYLEYTRGLPTRTPTAGEPDKEDRQSLTGFLFYQRRSPDLDMDVLFPGFWHVRDKENRAWVLGPIVHREAPGESDNWLAPLFFQGSRKDGGYFHSPLLLTTSHWSADKAFEWSALYFRDRTGSDIDWGVAPFYFHGDNGNQDGARKTYTFVPPLFYFHKETQIDESKLTVVGPVITGSSPKRSFTDVAPLFFHIQGHPESGGIDEAHTTFFPFFHTGYKNDESRLRLTVVPGFLHRSTATTETNISPFVSTAFTRNGSTSLYAVGPVAPLVWYYRDKDVNATAYAAVPFFYHSSSPKGLDWLTPLFGRFETYGVSRTYWTFPSIVVSLDKHGWESDAYPLAFFGRSDERTHSVLAPLFWDFASPKGRTTIVAPLFWRFADSTDDSVTEVAGNFVYLRKRVPGGLDSQFHVVPVFSHGDIPYGHWWNVLFGLVGYSHETDGTETTRILWIPFTTGHDDRAAKAAALARGKDPAFHGAKF
jgi:hypothetical protein